MFLSGPDPQMIRLLMQLDLDRVADWCAANILTVNSEKTKILWCRKHTQPLVLADVQIKLEGNTLEVVNNFCYLGIWIDQFLRFELMIARHIGLLSNNLRQIWRLQRKAGPDLCITIYKQLILPIIEYGDHILGCAPPDRLKAIQIMQNKCLRACLGIHDTRLINNRALHATAGLVPLETRRKWHLLTYMYKAAQCPENRIMAARPLRSNIKIKLIFDPKAVTGNNRSPWERGKKIWDALPAEIQHAESLSSFKSLVKRHVV